MTFGKSIGGFLPKRILPAAVLLLVGYLCAGAQETRLPDRCNESGSTLDNNRVYAMLLMNF